MDDQERQQKLAEFDQTTAAIKREIETKINANLAEWLDAVVQKMREKREGAELDKHRPHASYSASFSIPRPIRNLLKSGSAGMEKTEPSEASTKQLVSQIGSLEQEIGQLKEQLDQARRDAAGKDKENRKLHKIIISNKMSGEGPTDAEIENSFGQLVHSIFQVINRICDEIEVKDDGSIPLPVDMRAWWIMGMVSDFLYDRLFSPEALLFGFDRDTDTLLGVFENFMSNSSKVSYEERVNWRMKTAELSRRYDLDGKCALDMAAAMVHPLHEQLAPFIYPDEVSSRACEASVQVEVCKICEQAYKVALLFRRAKTEFAWMQKTVNVLEGCHIRVYSSEGLKSFAEAKEVNQIRVVFGALAKGYGKSGRLKEGFKVLRRGDVLLGPFPAGLQPMEGGQGDAFGSSFF
ncbi:hypothetical protein NA57DRAFT_73681 [Rhizodiscina lignyota]|uniref:Uncharacterized protein n=1 Tax=Rhizodiscina lignyota TaxID=1504668 RepID=A0A9P4M9L5_9PEZI|nr:hypothetical protein NA57DRAFT_73681 [Rhizodiscina lignyota]